jgi:hypothetical protein
MKFLKYSISHSIAFPVVLGSKTAKALQTGTEVKWNIKVYYYIQESDWTNYDASSDSNNGYDKDHNN